MFSNCSYWYHCSGGHLLFFLLFLISSWIMMMMMFGTVQRTFSDSEFFLGIWIWDWEQKKWFVEIGPRHATRACYHSWSTLFYWGGSSLSLSLFSFSFFISFCWDIFNLPSLCLYWKEKVLVNIKINVFIVSNITVSGELGRIQHGWVSWPGAAGWHMAPTVHLCPWCSCSLWICCKVSLLSGGKNESF